MSTLIIRMKMCYWLFRCQLWHIGHFVYLFFLCVVLGVHMCAPRKYICRIGTRTRYPQAASQPRYQYAIPTPQYISGWMPCNLILVNDIIWSILVADFSPDKMWLVLISFKWILYNWDIGYSYNYHNYIDRVMRLVFDIHYFACSDTQHDSISNDIRMSMTCSRLTLGIRTRIHVYYKVKHLRNLNIEFFK